MRVVICAACKSVLGYIGTSSWAEEEAQLLAYSHKPNCNATPEQYEQARYDLKFRQIVKGLDL